MTSPCEAVSKSLAATLFLGPISMESHHGSALALVVRRLEELIGKWKIQPQQIPFLIVLLVLLVFVFLLVIIPVPVPLSFSFSTFSSSSSTNVSLTSKTSQCTGTELDIQIGYYRASVRLKQLVLGQSMFKCSQPPPIMTPHHIGKATNFLPVVLFTSSPRILIRRNFV